MALAVPLYNHFGTVRRAVLPMTAALLAGSITAVVSADPIPWLLGASGKTLASLAPKSVTTPTAMGITEQIGGLPSLTAVLVILTGIIGAIALGPLFDLLGLENWPARGFAAGIAAPRRGGPAPSRDRQAGAGNVVVPERGFERTRRGRCRP